MILTGLGVLGFRALKEYGGGGGGRGADPHGMQGAVAFPLQCKDSLSTLAFECRAHLRILDHHGISRCFNADAPAGETKREWDGFQSSGFYMTNVGVNLIPKP